jgi:hypothetical protein
MRTGRARAASLGILALGLAGCSWLVGVAGDPVIVDADAEASTGDAAWPDAGSVLADASDDALVE